LPSPLFQIQFPNNPDGQISVEASRIILNAVKTTLSQKNAGSVADAEPVSGLNQTIFLSQKQWETLFQNSDLFITILEQAIQNATKEPRSAAPTNSLNNISVEPSSGRTPQEPPILALWPLPENSRS
jgi:hypothetical protein